jgi:uncharacterized protein
MKVTGSQLTLSATDLSNFLGCRHRTALEMGEAFGKRRRPHFDDPLLALLHERGLAHEREYVESLREEREDFEDLSDVKRREEAIARTVDAMRRGVQVVVQGALGNATWYGRPDVLCRVETRSGLGEWSYDVTDTKLARETRAGTILQLGLYSELLAETQGMRPEFFHVVTPGIDRVRHSYRVDEYSAYLRLVRKQLLDTVARDDELVAAAYYPEPVDHCDVCPWSPSCRDKRLADDHLSLVANITKLQRVELVGRDVTTLTKLAQLPLPLEFQPRRGSTETFVRSREQARLQLASRSLDVPVHALRDTEQERGFARLPEPSPGDVFLDLEGDLFARESGREYLFGVVTVDAEGRPSYRPFWAFSDEEERRAFEAVIDLIMEAWDSHEGMHVYHYAPYEPSAFKRLMGRYATRARELDRLLRGKRFVDLYAVVRQGLLIGVERYSIKKLEPLYAFERLAKLEHANKSLKVMEYHLQVGRPGETPNEHRETVLAYNRDDCVSTLALRGWLEQARAQAIADGAEILRPSPSDAAPSEKVGKNDERVATLRARLLTDVASNPDERTASQHARWRLAFLLDFHRREDKASWWEYFRLRDLPEEDLFDEPQAIADLAFVHRVDVKLRKSGKPTGSVVDRYRYPPQDMEIGIGDELKLKDGVSFGKVRDVDRAARTIDVGKGPKVAEHHPTSVFAHTHVSSEPLEDAIFDIATRIVDEGGLSSDGLDTPGPEYDLLLSRAPRIRSGAFDAGNANVQLAVLLMHDLDRSVLPIQGPPGSGKTHCGAAMIADLVAKGKRVGVTATSHKVIHHLLSRAGDAARALGVPIRLAHKIDEGVSDSRVAALGSNAAAREALRNGMANVVGGTAWLWASPELAGSVDVLFVDEAGQMSLANVLAVTPAAKSLVLLGDPRQLEQPQRAAHPDGVDVSALAHLLQGRITVPRDRGIFLPVTRRLTPGICAFTSEVFYERKLSSMPGLELQRLHEAGEFDGSGLWVVEVAHEGNRNSSDDEVAVVEAIVDRLTGPDVAWSNTHGTKTRMTGAHILVVAPYNAQVSRLAERLETHGVRVGTVDRFQGQEAPAVIYSMATSRPEDAPRGMEFLYSMNRLNVATSRAMCAAIIVASPRLFEPECRSPRQMQLANALCRFREMARVVDGRALTRHL